MSANDPRDMHREMIEALTFQRDEALASIAQMGEEIERLTRDRDALRSQNDSLYHSVINARAQVNDLLQTAGCVGPDGVPFTVSVFRDRLDAAERKVAVLREAITASRNSYREDLGIACVNWGTLATALKETE